MSASRDRLHFLRSLPEASTHHPTFDPSKVKTNLSPDQLRLALNTFGHFVWHEDAYKANIGRCLMPLEFTVRKRDDGGVEAQTVFEAKVTKGMWLWMGGRLLLKKRIRNVQCIQVACWWLRCSHRRRVSLHIRRSRLLLALTAFLQLLFLRDRRAWGISRSRHHRCLTDNEFGFPSSCTTVRTLQSPEQKEKDTLHSGTTLRIVNTSLAVGGKVSSARSEVNFISRFSEELLFIDSGMCS
jgi:hypothetical protein